MNNKINCPSCGASIDAGVQVCPICGSQVYMQQQPMMQQPVQQPMMQQPVQQPMMQQPVQQPMPQPVMYDPNTGQPMQQQPMMNVGQVPAEADNKTKLYIALALVILGYFVAGIICASVALILGLGYKGKSPLKIVVLILAGLELGLMVLYIASLV